jgi:hypothetical protein
MAWRGMSIENPSSVVKVKYKEAPMKFVCLGYIEENKFETLPEKERNAMMDECFTYDDFLRKNNHFAADLGRGVHDR